MCLLGYLFRTYPIKRRCNSEERHAWAAVALVIRPYVLPNTFEPACLSRCCSWSYQREVVTLQPQKYRAHPGYAREMFRIAPFPSLRRAVAVILTIRPSASCKFSPYRDSNIVRSRKEIGTVHNRTGSALNSVSRNADRKLIACLAQKLRMWEASSNRLMTSSYSVHTLFRSWLIRQSS